MTSGAGALGSPKVTAAASNLATAWRTRHLALRAEADDLQRLRLCGQQQPAHQRRGGPGIPQSVFIVFITLACKGDENPVYGLPRYFAMLRLKQGS